MWTHLCATETVEEMTNPGRKGLIRENTALSPDSLHFLLFNLGWGGKGQLHY